MDSPHTSILVGFGVAHCNTINPYRLALGYSLSIYKTFGYCLIFEPSLFPVGFEGGNPEHGNELYSYSGTSVLDPKELGG